MNTCQKKDVKTVKARVFPDTENAISRYHHKSFDIGNQINTFANNISPNDKKDSNVL